MSQEQLLQQSVDRYQAMLHHLVSLTELLKTADPETINVALVEWHQLQERTRQVDVQLDALEEISQEVPLAQRRIELMAEVALQCRQVCSKASLLKAMVGDELNQLRHGRKALGGYKGGSSHKGSRLTASF